MANIPGIIGWTAAGAYSVVDVRPGPVTLPGGPTVVAILGKGKREEYIVTRAVGNGADGAPAGFDPANDPDGRHFQISYYPIVPGSLEIFINPKMDGTDLPLVRITSDEMAMSWSEEFGDIDGYDGVTPFNGVLGYPYGVDSIDGYKGASDGSGFFDQKWGHQYKQLKERLNVQAGTAEPNHYILDIDTGRFILDQPLNPYDTLVVSYIAESDLNSPELMFSLDEVFKKHGYPSKENTISLAAQIANENGASVFMPVHAGEVLEGEGSAKRLIADPTLGYALEALEREDCDILVPVMSSRVSNEIIMPFYEMSVYGSMTDNGRFLQESPATGDQPGINISPLAMIPVGQVNAGNPVFLEVYKNGSLLKYGVDYSVPNLDGSQINGTSNVLIAFDPTYPGANHSVDNTLQEGDKIVANYLPNPSVIDLVATSQLACVVHCETMSQTKYRKERTCLFGSYEFVDLDFIIDSVTGIEENFGSTKRAMYFWPGGASVTRVVGGEAQIIDGQFIAPAAAGYVSSHPIPFSLTNKTLSGFTINPKQKLTIDEMNVVGGAGVTIVAPLAAGGKVVLGQTTTASGNAVEEEYSVVRITDHTAKTVRTQLENSFTGELITPNLVARVKAATESMLASLKSQGIINEYANVKAVVDPQEPRQIDVSFDITPVFPLNWIFVRFSVGI